MTSMCVQKKMRPLFYDFYVRNGKHICALTQSTSNMSPSEGMHPMDMDVSPNRRVSLHRTRSNRDVKGHAAQMYDREHDAHVGAEPGVNPRSGAAIAEYSHFKEECIIDVIDYDDQEVRFQQMDNSQFVQFMAGPGNASPDVAKGSDDDVPPLSIRWINIAGIDWNVLSTVALRYNLDSLALEDILHERGHNHSKADYYPNHLFLRVLCHTLDSLDLYDDDEDNREGSKTATPSHTPLTTKRTTSYNAAENGESRTNSGHIDGQMMSDAASIPSVTSTQALNKVEAQAEIIVDSHSSPEQRSYGKVLKKPFSSMKRALKRRFGSLSGNYKPAHHEQIVRLRELKKDQRVEVRKEPWFVFLLRNGTVISIHPAVVDYAAPIKERLHQSDSVLRTSDDPSLLVESLVDLVVDRILEVMDEYQVKINELERDILISPSMDAVRSLHIISGDLIMHKRTLDPIKTMIFGLRRYDLDRCIALQDSLTLAKREQQVRREKKEHARNRRKGKQGNKQQQQQQQQGLRPSRPSSPRPTLGPAAITGTGSNGHLALPAPAQQAMSVHSVDMAPSGVMPHASTASLHTGEHSDHEHGSVRSDDQHMRAMAAGHIAHPVNGYFSYKAKVFLADVYDHMDFALSSLDMFAATTENLINYAFNIASYDMNIVMNRLTLVTIIFLPLTLLTGYFGMNFTPFWSVENNSDVFFWKLAAPIMAILIPLFMISDIKQAWKSWRRRRDDYRAVQELKVGLEAAGWKLVDERRGRR